MSIHVGAGTIPNALEHRTAVVTGSGTGIGAAIARRFVAEGAFVCLTGPDEAVLATVSRSLPSGRTAVCPGDVSNQADDERAVELALARTGRLDIVVNNAAIGTDPSTDLAATTGCAGSVADSDPEAFRRTVEVNLTGQYLLMRAALPHMMEAGYGSIVNIASVAGLRADPDAAAYGASKAGVVMLSRQAALDYGPSGIRVNAVCPGLVRTPSSEAEVEDLMRATNQSIEQVFSDLTRHVPLRRIGEPKEIAALCVFLASDESSFITGEALVIDGGSTIVDATNC